MQQPIDRREIREHLEKTKRFWEMPNGQAVPGGIADAIITLLVEHDIEVVDSDWSY